jgi:polynucleotide 5'-hydroxyl-kinase GRC3/NOL9
MPPGWAEKIAQQFLTQGLMQKGICLILGASDTGKTTLAMALAKYALSSGPVGIIDADVGQSHIGPPGTVGWALVDNPQVDFSRLTVGGISFVGDVTPVGHLLQLTAAITQCTRRVSKKANLIIIDTPGFVHGPAAAALWWTVQQILQPELILAVQRDNELSDILAGLQGLDLRLELVSSPSQIRLKSPQDRRSYRQKRFNEYFQNSCVYNIDLSDIAVQPRRNLTGKNLTGRVAALRDGRGVDVAMGLIMEWQNDRNIAVVRAPELNIQQVCCLVIGDVSVEIPNK